MAHQHEIGDWYWPLLVQQVEDAGQGPAVGRNVQSGVVAQQDWAEAEVVVQSSALTIAMLAFFDRSAAWLWRPASTNLVT